METFTCAACGGTFPMAWSDEDAKAEAKDLWGAIPASKMVVVCDDCFQPGLDAALSEHAALGHPKSAEEAARRRKRR